MSEICQGCTLKSHNNKSCLEHLNEISSRLSSQISSQKQILSHYENSSLSLSKGEFAFDLFKSISHQFACCDSCYDLPLTGTRYKCKECPNFDLCFRCRHSSGHQHRSFYAITTGNFHSNKQCHLCFGKIADVIHKCAECFQELCHECLIVNGHPHANIIDFLPFDVIVEWNSNRNLMKLKKDEEVQIKFVIFNNSLQEIRRLTVRDEGCPFVVVRKEVDVVCKFQQIVVLEVSGIVRPGSGNFMGKFEIVESICEEVIAPPVFIKMSVSEGLFSSFFKS